jgi:hypothetical protein
MFSNSVGFTSSTDSRASDEIFPSANHQLNLSLINYYTTVTGNTGVLNTAALDKMEFMSKELHSLKLLLEGNDICQICLEEMKTSVNYRANTSRVFQEYDLNSTLKEGLNPDLEFERIKSRISDDFFTNA